MKKTVIIVDPMSTGRFYAPIFRELGINCIALISRQDLPDHFKKDLNSLDFSQVIDWSETAIDHLKHLNNVVAVVAGCETAIHLTDEVAEKLDVKGNPSISSDIRRDKFAMQNALKANGLAHIPSYILETADQIQDIDQIREFFQARGAGEGYVVKPTNSAATDGVVFTMDLIGVEQVLRDAKWNQKNDLGEINKGFIVQPFISGPEYVVDMVAFNGVYTIASVCKYKKIARNGGQFVYDSLDLLDPADLELSVLVGYAKLAAKALEISVGPVHMEIICSKDGPVMIEAGARLHGGIAPDLFRKSYQPDLLTLSVQSYLNTRENEHSDYSKLTVFGKIGFLYSDVKESFTEPDASVLEEVGQDPSYCGHRYFVSEGDILPVTIDFATCPGLFWIAHHDEKQLEVSERNLRGRLWKQSIR